MIPLKDDNPTRSFPLITLLIIGVNVLIHISLMPLSPEAHKTVVYQFGFIPRDLFAGGGEGGLFPVIATLFSSMFLHGSFMHLAGNMLYMWIFGNNIEDIMGKFRFLLFYLLCGLGGAILQGILKPTSGIPMIGASGAISGVMGAYLIKFPRVRVSVLFFFFMFIQIIKVPASVVLGFWIFFQIIMGLGSIGAKGGGVAFFAHIGGFAAGILLLKLFERRKRYYGRWAPFSG